MPRWEIIYGERRWLAAKAAGTLYPATVRDVGDTEALELQAVENMQREDLNPIDEATKYEQLRAAYEGEGLKRTDAVKKICEKTGKGESTVYQRLALMKLAPEVRVAVQRGKLPPSHADLVAGMPSVELQHQLTKMILHPEAYNANDEGILSFRQAKQKAEDITRKAGNLARWQSKADEFEKKGWEVLTPAACKKLMPHGYFQGNDYVADGLDSCAANGKTWAKLIKKDKVPQPILARSNDGSPKVIYRRAELVAAAKACGHDLKEQSSRSCGDSGYAKEHAAKKLRHQRRERVLLELRPQVIAACKDAMPADGFLRLVLLDKLGQGIDYGFLKRFVAREGIKGKGTDERAWIREYAQELNQKELRGLIAELMLETFAPCEWQDRHHVRLGDVCTALGLDLGAAEKAVPKLQASGKKAQEVKI